MPRIEPELQRLQDIKSLPSLIKYLKDDLHWPIESDDVDEVAFDYDPAELGFDSESTAKIEEVRQLRPLTAGQKWGVFWVKFSKKRLPVQMLRRALANLVVKKRASSKSANKAAWHMHDLLFISAYGDDSNRHVTFAHFSGEDDAGKSLPVLKVLGWDEEDTVLHLRDAYKTLLAKLDWGATPTDDPDAWREQWSSAFKIGHREVINTTKELVVELAHLATVIKKSVLTSINAETEKGPWKKLMKAFKDSLIKDLDEEQFADVIAQTVSYGLLTARLSSDGPISLKNLVEMAPSTNPFLKELLQHFLTSAGMKGLFDVDEAGINDVVELLNRANAQAIRNDFGKKTDGEDPVIHFYEHFLGAYNKKLKVERGVFYTPQAVVSYIVRSVHELLQSEFGLENGLADTSTWADVRERHKDLNIPAGINPEIEPFVQILDPATGTATFLIEVIEVIHNTMKTKWDKERVSKADQIKKWNAYVPTHLLPRLYAYELMMAPYAIAHMKVGLKLSETGFTAWDKIGKENRANIFLTNALEPWEKQLQLIGFDALAHEAAAVNEVKRHKRFTVVIGNPPYSGHSTNIGPWITSMVNDYYFVDGKPLGEKNTKWLLDDYVKFIRLGEKAISTSGCGVLGFITNHGFIDNPTFRGMRAHLLKSFNQLSALDLHGNAKKATKALTAKTDDNVFDIQQGVAITLGVKSNSSSLVRHSDLVGSRLEKYGELTRTTASTTSWETVEPTTPFYVLEFQDANLRDEYEAAIKVTDIFPLNGWGIATRKDYLLVDFDHDALVAKFKDIVSEPAKKSIEKYEIQESPHWDFAAAIAKLPKTIEKSVHPLLFRPFDTRYVYYERAMIERGDHRYPLMRHMLQPNICLITIRRLEVGGGFEHTFCADQLSVLHSISMKEGNFVFPLFAYPDEVEQQTSLLAETERRPNFGSGFLRSLAAKLCLPNIGKWQLPAGLKPEDIFNYTYAVLHSPSYRLRYAEFLKIDFPRLPLTGSLEMFRALARLGEDLISIHLLKSPQLTQPITEFIGVRSPEVEKVSWSKDTVWIDKAQTIGFRGVPVAVWNFQIGGYQVCEKWLKDRKSRKLCKGDIEQYQKIVVALSETIRLMAEIDKVIDEHGGWPSAFHTQITQ